MTENGPASTGRVCDTKIRPPRLPEDFVPRPRVHELLAEGRGRRLTFVCAPAGFGKTIELAGWLLQERRPWVWVGLDELDSDLVTFTSVLVAALGTVVPLAGRQALALAAQTETPSVSQLTALIVDDLARIDDELVLVLDDFHLIQDPSIHALLSLLVRHLPPTVQLVIASREEPPLRLALLRGQHELAEVRADDLRFDRSEAAALVRGMRGAALDERLLADAAIRSEGWAVGLRLLTLVGPPPAFSQSDPAPVAARGRQFVDAYLFEEVLARQTPELQRFLTQTSILERFCAPLCEAVAGSLEPGDARRLLDECLAAGLFVMALDDEERWYRFHHLFRDMLRRRLQRDEGAERVRALRLRASDWLAGQRMWDEAATHAIDANDVDRVTALVEACLLTEQSIDARVMIDSWIRRLPPDVMDSSPTLSVARCRMLAIRGEVGRLEAESRRVEAMLATKPSLMSPALLPIALGQINSQLGWVLYQRGGADHEALARFERALDLLPMDQYDYRGVAAMLYPTMLHNLGETERALAWLGTELNQGTALHADYVARLLIGLVYVELGSGRLAAADHTGRRMVALGNAHQHSLVTGWGHLALGQIAYEWNDLDGAREHCEAVLALGRRAHRMSSVHATLGLAKTLVAQGHHAEAERMVLEELAHAEEDGSTFFVESLRSFMARLALGSNNIERAVYWLAGVTYARRAITVFDVEDLLLTRAKVLAAMATSEDLGEAETAVEQAIEAAESRHLIASHVQGLALRALVERSRGDISRATKSLARALEIAEPGRFTRAFVDLGPPLTELLVELARHGRLPKGGERLLDICRAESGVPTSRLPSRDGTPPRLAEVLTWRELDVLHLMEGHHTNKEIAELLSISEETVKKHAANIYGKLEVKGRRHAVARAHDLGILRIEARQASPSA